MPYAQPMKIKNGLVLDFTVSSANTVNDNFLGVNASNEVTAFSSIPRSRVSGGGNITESTSSVLTITGGTAAVLTSGLTIQVKLAGAAQSGYLSTTDWNTFNNKLSGSLTSANIYVGNGSNIATEVAMTGDITISNAGVTAIGAGVIVNADINASAAIAVSKLAALTASRVVGTDGSGFIQALTTATYPSLTELSYVKGVTSSLQTQLNSKLSVTLSSPTSGDVISYNGSAWVNSASSGTGVPSGGTTNQILRKIDATNYNTEWHTLVAADITDVSSSAAELNKLTGVTTTATQFNFLNTASGDIQAQLNAKLSTSLTLNNLWVGNGSNIASQLAAGTDGYVLQSVSGVPTWVSPGVGGTVTSVAASGGTTGMSFTGSPITTSGTITLTGTLGYANGGTGLTALGTANQLLRINAGATALEYFTPSYGVGDMVLASTQTNTGAKSFNSGTFILKGATSGTTTFNANATAGTTTITLPATTGTVALTSDLSGWLTGTLTGDVTITGAQTRNLYLGGPADGDRLNNFLVSANGQLTLNSGAIIGVATKLDMTSSNGRFYNNDGVSSSEVIVQSGTIAITDNSGRSFSINRSTSVRLDLTSDATGDTYYRNSSGYFTRLPVGSNGQVLTLASGLPSWATPSSGFSDPMTTRGDIIFRNSSNTTARLGRGTANQVLTSDGTDIAWATPSSGGADALGTYLVQTATNAPANAQVMASLATGIVKNTTATGVQSIAVAGDFPTLNQNTTGSAATLTTSRTIGIATGDVTSAGSAFNGSANNTNAYTIANNAVTYAKMQSMTDARLLGRASGGAGVPQEISVGANMSLSSLVLNLATTISLTRVTATATLGGTGTAFVASSSNPGYSWNNTSAGSDLKVWDMYASTTQLVFRAANDASSAANSWLTVDRTGYVPTMATFTLNTLRVGDAAAGTKSISFKNVNEGLLSWNPTGSRTITIPDRTDTLVTLAGSEALTNKSVNGVTLTTGGGTSNFLRADGTYAAPSGGITNSAVNTELMMSNGTNAISSNIFATAASGNLTLGSASLAGNRVLSAINSTTNANLTFSAEGYIGFSVGSQTSTLSSTTISGNAVHSLALGNNGGGPIGGLITIANDGVGTTKGGSLYFVAGSPASGVNDGGDMYFRAGLKASTGKDGNYAFNSISTTWQSMQGGIAIKNGAALPTAGITDSVALIAQDSNSLSELYTYSESGAKINITGLLEPKTESGTSITLDETHRGKVVVCTNSGAITVTLNAGKADGWNCILLVTHATGTITLAGTATVHGTTSTTTQYETLSLLNYGSDVYISKLG